MVARMRFWCTPWPSWTSEELFSRMNGMSRLTASSMIAWVDGPNADRSPRMMKLLELGLEVELGIVLDQVVDQPDRELAGRQPDRLVGVGEDHVVLAADTLHPTRLAAAHVVADRLLQLQGDVLGHVAQPGALLQPLHEPAAPTAAAGVVAQTRQPLQQALGEAGDQVGGEVLQHAQVDDQLDRRLVVPHVRARGRPGWTGSSARGGASQRRSRSWAEPLGSRWNEAWWCVGGSRLILPPTDPGCPGATGY